MSGMTAVLNISTVAILNIVKGNNSISNLLYESKKYSDETLEETSYTNRFCRPANFITREPGSPLLTRAAAKSLDRETSVKLMP